MFFFKLNVTFSMGSTVEDSASEDSKGRSSEMGSSLQAARFIGEPAEKMMKNWP